MTLEWFTQLKFEHPNSQDLAALLTQFNVFSGSQLLGATRSFIGKFCTTWENSYVCVDLLHLYLVTSVLRDKVFYHLAAIVKDSEHNEADIISEQIMVASKYKCVHISFIIPVIKI